MTQRSAGPALRGARNVIVAMAVLAGCDASNAAVIEPPPSTISSTARSHLEEVVGIMQRESMRRDSIDWPAFRSEVFHFARDAQRVSDLIPAIRRALELLNDNHSSYRSTLRTYVFASSFSCSTLPLASLGALPSDIAYVRVRAFSGSGVQADSFASSIQDAIQRQDVDGVTGWIVDLRSNTGGNMWPMLSGIGPLLGTDTVGYFVDPARNASPWSYRSDGSSLNSGRVVHQSPVAYQLRKALPRVAVLTNKLTASSGEAIAIAFRGRPNTRSFGDETCGLSTANAASILSDGAILNLTRAVMADRTRRMYGVPVVPDEIVASTTVVGRAVTWLQSSDSQ